MTQPDIACDLCGNKLADPRLANEMFLVATGEKSIGAQRHQRMFEGECPEHGRRFVAFPSEGHSTLLAAKFRKLFTRAERRALRAKLSGRDRSNFQAAWNGQYAWDDEDLAHWRQALT